ncbi:MAG: hypothetical protein ABIF06_01335 [bacterium]
MPKNKILISFGVLIALLPFLGFPPSWESFFEVVVGLSIIGITVWATIDKKLTQKAKAQKRLRLKQVEVEQVSEPVIEGEISGNQIQ